MVKRRNTTIASQQMKVMADWLLKRDMHVFVEPSCASEFPELRVWDTNLVTKGTNNYMFFPFSLLHFHKPLMPSS
jgi:hypothetical protein